MRLARLLLQVVLDAIRVAAHGGNGGYQLVQRATKQQGPGARLGGIGQSYGGKLVSRRGGVGDDFLQLLMHVRAAVGELPESYSPNGGPS